MKHVVILVVFVLVVAGIVGVVKIANRPLPVVSHGEYVYFGDHLEGPDDIVVFQFTADWCGPCRQIKPHVTKLVNEYDNVHYKFVDVVSWDTAAANQMSEEYGGSGIPFFVVYDGQGDELATGHVDAVSRALSQYAQAR